MLINYTEQNYIVGAIGLGENDPAKFIVSRNVRELKTPMKSENYSVNRFLPDFSSTRKKRNLPNLFTNLET